MLNQEEWQTLRVLEEEVQLVPAEEEEEEEEEEGTMRRVPEEEDQEEQPQVRGQQVGRG
ncbi:MAG: hypothetical protein NTX58_09740 [Actinobacteria bacterium]|nr:hypothetical protein [Actinomycetota bacterium]